MNKLRALAIIVFLLKMLFGGSATAQSFETLDSLVKAREFQEASRLAQSLRDRSPELAYPYLILGAASYECNKLQTAETYLQKGLSLDSGKTNTTGRCHLYMGRVLAKSHEIRMARQEFYLGTGSGYDVYSRASCYLELGEIYYESGDYDSTLYYFGQSIGLDKGSSEISYKAHLDLGQLYRRYGNNVAAELQFREALSVARSSFSVAEAKDYLVSQLEQKGAYTEALVLSKELLLDAPHHCSPQYSMGDIYRKMGRLDSAEYYLSLAIKCDRDQSWVSGWAHIRRGETYLQLSMKDSAIKELKVGLALGKTRNSIEYSQHLIDSLEGKTQRRKIRQAKEPNWVTIEREHIIYKFQDTNVSLNLKTYMDSHEQAYEKINQVFEAHLPTKMVFYVWFDREYAKRVLGRELGFTHPEKCVTNAAWGQSVGREMTHTLSYWTSGTEREYYARLISEGIAVAFDQSGRDKFETAKKALVNSGIRSVLDIWANDNIKESILYPLGGAWVTFLFEKINRGQFESIVKNQSMEHARKLLGEDEFAKLVMEFDEKVGLGKK